MPDYEEEVGMDPVHFTGREVLEMAVKIEENGLRFYTDAGKASKNKKIKDLFKTLADEEGRHVKVFADMRKYASEDTVAEGFDPYMAEASLYLKALADSEVFTRADEGRRFAEKVKEEKEVLQFAIDMEKDAILFYYEIDKMIRQKDKEVLSRLIDQEKEHLKRLSVLLAELYGKGL